MNKMVIWDLFGGGQNSVYFSLKEYNLLDKFDIYTFDITKPVHNKQFYLDLSQKNIVEIFSKFPKPDIILASPLCQSFSNVLNMKGGGTCFWKLNSKKNKLIERSVKEFNQLKSGFTKNLKSDVQLFIKRLGKKCIDNTLDLINFYKPKYWYIENPKQSLMWKYIQLNRKDFCKKNLFYLNEASYGKYGFLTTKATYFMSNIPMNLFKGKIDPPYFETIINGVKYYVLKDDSSIKVRRDLNSRMIGISSLQKIIKARNVKSGMGGMDFVQRNRTPQQKNKKSNEQICESGPASAIPHKLIYHIFKCFDYDLKLREKKDKSIINLIDLIALSNTKNDLSELKYHKMLFLIYKELKKQLNKEIFDCNFEAWKYGPVEIDFRKYWKNNCLQCYNKFNLSKLNQEEYKILLDVIYKFNFLNTSSLIELTHNDKIWKQNFISINGRNKINKTKIK